MGRGCLGEKVAEWSEAGGSARAEVAAEVRAEVRADGRDDLGSFYRCCVYGESEIYLTHAADEATCLHVVVMDRLYFIEVPDMQPADLEFITGLDVYQKTDDDGGSEYFAWIKLREVTYFLQELEDAGPVIERLQNMRGLVGDTITLSYEPVLALPAENDPIVANHCFSDYVGRGTTYIFPYPITINYFYSRRWPKKDLEIEDKDTAAGYLEKYARMTKGLFTESSIPLENINIVWVIPFVGGTWNYFRVDNGRLEHPVVAVAVRLAYLNTWTTLPPVRAKVDDSIVFCYTAGGVVDIEKIEE